MSVPFLEHPMARQASRTFPTTARGENPAELDAYNAAFHELGLDWHWDADVWATLEPIDGDRERVCAYLRAHHPHLLKVYDAEFLGTAIVEIKARQAATAAHLGRAANEARV
jgi:hypothetical protein